MALTSQALADEIVNIRYGDPGRILFDFRCVEVVICEPMDMLLVGFDPILAARWIADRYGYFLVHIGSGKGKVTIRG